MFLLRILQRRKGSSGHGRLSRSSPWMTGFVAQCTNPMR